MSLSRIIVFALILAAAASASAGVCEQGTKVHSNELFVDKGGKHTIDKIKGLSAEDCCERCSSTENCKAWNYETKVVNKS